MNVNALALALPRSISMNSRRRYHSGFVLLLAISAVIASTSSAFAQWQPPIGIPTPPIGITDTPPALPGSWTTSTTNFYYVRGGGTQSGNGFPGNPRGSIPNPIPAGAVVVLDNTTPLTGTQFTLNFAGTSSAKSWLISSGRVGLTGAGQAEIRYTGDTMIYGTYFIIDGIDLHSNTTQGSSVSFGDWDGSPQASFAAMRNSTIRGNGQSKGSNNSNAISRASNLVIYNTDVRDQGNWQFVGADVDCHGLSGFGGSDIWILDSRFYHNQGDGIQINSGAPNQSSANGVQRVYIGRNEFYENLQTGAWVKNGQDIIFSQNTFRNHKNGGGSAPINTGGQYLFTRVWWIYNLIYDGTEGIGIASDNGVTFTRDIYIVGNVIVNHSANAIFDRQGNNVYVVHNTIANYGTGFSASPNSFLNLRIENNIFWGRSGSGGYDIETESTSIAEKIKRNIFPASPRWSLDSILYTSLSSMQNADSTNRQSNFSATNPLFVSPTTTGIGNWRVAAGSPAIDNGALISDVYATFQSLYGLNIRLDREGGVRPAGTAYDIGAYEFGSSGGLLPPTPPTNVRICTIASRCRIRFPRPTSTEVS